MMADDFKSESDTFQSPQPTGCQCGHVCNGTLPVGTFLLDGERIIETKSANEAAVNINCPASCFTNSSKWFDTNAESAALSRVLSTSSSSTLVGGTNASKYWVCAKCRQATTDPKHSIGKVNSTIFYSCTPCWKQFRLQLILGLTFRLIQVHLCFTLFWITSPDDVLLKAKARNHTEWVLIIFVIVLTVSLPGTRVAGHGVADKNTSWSFNTFRSSTSCCSGLCPS